MVELIPAYGDRNLYIRMAKDYVKTLQQYDSEIIWDEGTWLEAMWHTDFIMEDRTVQGFVYSEIVPFNVFPDAFYIGEFYVVPEARLRGIGTEAVKELMTSWKGDVYLYILHGNFPARAFWLSVEHEMGWKRIERPEISGGGENCELRVYQQG